jgi:hypothetical protein
MEDTLNAMLLSTLPDAPTKKTRPSNRTAKRIVKNSVKGKTTKISVEQGFRNYLKYTDPLLQESDETDQSKLADDMEKIINLVKPAENISKSAVKHLRNEPVDKGDILSEIQPIKLSFTPNKKASIEIYTPPAKTNEEEQKKKAEEERKAKLQQEQQKAKDVLSSAIKTRKAKKEVKNLQEEKEAKLQQQQKEEQKAKEDKSANVIHFDC